jgi:hypothetical protein
MAVIKHDEYTIVSTPVYDDDSGRWKFSASVSWPQNGIPRGTRFLTNSPERFSRFEDAEQAGLQAARNWIESVDHKDAVSRVASGFLKKAR